jgi:hypothetical protein
VFGTQPDAPVDLKPTGKASKKACILRKIHTLLFLNKLSVFANRLVRFRLKQLIRRPFGAGEKAIHGAGDGPDNHEDHKGRIDHACQFFETAEIALKA